MKYRDSDPSFPPDVAILVGSWLVAVPSILLQNLRGGTWWVAYVVALAVVVRGGLFLFEAKLPTYRQKRFLTFGVRGLPVTSVPVYWRGWRWVAAGVGMAGFLLLRGD